MISYNFTPKNNIEDAIRELMKIISMLKSPEGCPYDREQTKESSLSQLIDEAYEYLDAVNKDNIDGQKEEIGDIFWNAFFLMNLNVEKSDFTFTEAINEVCFKMVSRHRHVFGDVEATNSEEVLTLWDKIKEKDNIHNTDLTDIFKKIPMTLPPLMESYEIQKKIKKMGLEFANIDDVIGKIEEELNELKSAIKANDKSNMSEELGDLLFSVINLSRYLKIKPNMALHGTNEKIKARFQKVIDLAIERNMEISNKNMDKLDQLWNEAKTLS